MPTVLRTSFQIALCLYCLCSDSKSKMATKFVTQSKQHVWFHYWRAHECCAKSNLIIVLICLAGSSKCPLNLANGLRNLALNACAVNLSDCRMSRLPVRPLWSNQSSERNSKIMSLTRTINDIRQNVNLKLRVGLQRLHYALHVQVSCGFIFLEIQCTL